MSFRLVGEIDDGPAAGEIASLTAEIERLTRWAAALPSAPSPPV
jgi:hypothetical protein